MNLKFNSAQFQHDRSPTVLRIAGKGLGVVIGPGGGGPGQDHPETGGHVADRGDPETNSGPDRETDSGPDPETDDLGIDDLAPKRGAAQDRRAHGGPGMIGNSRYFVLNDMKLLTIILIISGKGVNLYFGKNDT